MIHRYIARPPLAKNRLVSDGEGEYRILLKKPWSDGTSSIRVGLLELMVTERSGVGESPNEERNRMTTCSDHSPTENASGVVLWCVCEQCEVSKRDFAEVSKSTRKMKWKKLSRKDGSKSRHVAWAQLLWRSFGVMGFVCQHCGCLMRLRAVAIYSPATTKIVRGLGVNLHGLGFTGPL